MSSLRLQVLLGAVDRLTAPLRSVTGQSRTTAKELAETKKRIKELEAQSGQVEGYRTLGRQIGTTRADLSAAQRDAQQMAQQLATVERPTKAMTAAMEAARQKVRALSQQEREMVNRHGALRQSLGQAGINTRQLGEHQRRLRTDLAAATGQLEQQRASLSRLADQQKRMNKAKASYAKTQELRGQLAGHGAGAVTTGTAMALPIISAVKNYASFEDAMKGVAKQVEGARDDSGQLTSVYYDMAKQIKIISEEIPQVNGAIDIANLVEGAARMGVQGQDNLLNFAKTAAKAASAFELPAGQLAEDMGKIANLYKIPISNIEELGDTINFLDDSAQSKGADIINVLQRMGGVADKLSYKKAAALGSTFLTLGSAAEVAASASNAIVRELGIATMQGEKFDAGLKMIGLNDKSVQKAMSKDAMGTITNVLERIKKLKPEDQMTVTTMLFGKEYGDDAAKLANNMGELYRQLELVNAAKAKGSMQKESDIDKDSLSSQWLLLQAGMQNAKIDIGSQLRGSLMDIIEYAQQAVGAVRKWIEANPELANTLVKVAAVTSVIVIALGGLSLAVAAALGPLAVMKFALGGSLVKLDGLFASSNRATNGLSIFSRIMALNSRMAAPLLAKWTTLGNLFRGLSFSAVRAGMTGMLTTITALPAKIGAMTVATWRYVIAQIAASKALVATRFTALITGLRSATTAAYAYVAANGIMGTSFNLLKAGMGSAIALLKGGLVGSLTLVGNAIAFVGRMLLMNPIGLLVVAIGIAALTIYRYWEPVKAFFSGFFQGLKEGLGPVAAIFAPAFGAMANAIRPMKPIWDSLSSAVGSAWRWMTSLLTPIQTTQQELNGATNAGKQFGLWLGGLGQSFIQVIADFTKFGSELIDGLLAGISAKWDALKAKLASLSSLMPSWLGGSGANVTIKQAAASPALAPKKAAASAAPGFAGMFDRGGIIPRGQWGIAGENGPEAIEGPARVTSRRATAAMASAAMLATMPLAAMPNPQLDAARTIREQIVPSGVGIRPAARIVDTPRPIARSSSSTTHINAPITIHQQPGQSGADVAQEVRRELDRRERQASARTRASLRDTN
ncbi:MAG: phage tail tape measure protein [Aeromonas sp.]